MRNISDKVVERMKTHILLSETFSRKSCRLWDHVGRCSRAGRPTRFADTQKENM